MPDHLANLKAGITRMELLLATDIQPCETKVRAIAMLWADIKMELKEVAEELRLRQEEMGG